MIVCCSFVIPSLDIGGAERQLLNYVRRRPRDVRVDVFLYERDSCKFGAKF